jgi:hypothetical protein
MLQDSQELYLTQQIQHRNSSKTDFEEQTQRIFHNLCSSDNIEY